MRDEKLVRDCFDYLPHRVATAGERYGLLAAKLDEEIAEVKAASIGTAEFVSELADLVEVCYALGGEESVERARLAKKDERGGFDRLLVMRLEDRTDAAGVSTDEPCPYCGCPGAQFDGHVCEEYEALSAGVSPQPKEQS